MRAGVGRRARLGGQEGERAQGVGLEAGRAQEFQLLVSLHSLLLSSKPTLLRRPWKDLPETIQPFRPAPLMQKAPSSTLIQEENAYFMRASFSERTAGSPQQKVHAYIHSLSRDEDSAVTTNPTFLGSMCKEGLRQSREKQVLQAYQGSPLLPSKALPEAFSIPFPGPPQHLAPNAT